MTSDSPSARLPRLYPSPLPPIVAVPEYLAESDLKADYEDTKAALQVPWMGVVAMAFAHHRVFYRAVWSGLRPLVVSAAFLDACRRLRTQAEAAVMILEPPRLTSRLADLGYAPREIAQIREMIEVFSHGNFPYCFMATIARLLLEGHELSTCREAPHFTGSHAPPVDVPFLLMEPHHADAPTKAVYRDIQTRLGLPFVNTDYRALARWPSYFALAWADLSRHVATSAYEEIVTDLHDAFVSAARRLPNPGGLISSKLMAAAAEDQTSEEILAVVRLFQWLLPGLIANVAFFRAGLSASR